MPKVTTPLTALQINQAKPRDKEYSLADGQGLMLRIKPSGSKLWLFNYYRPYTKIRANFSLGTYPGLTLLMAREARAEARALLAKDIDPRDHKAEQIRQQKAAQNNTLKYAVDQWIELKRAKVSHDHALDIYRSASIHRQCKKTWGLLSPPTSPPHNYYLRVLVWPARSSPPGIDPPGV